MTEKENISSTEEQEKVTKEETAKDITEENTQNSSETPVEQSTSTVYKVEETLGDISETELAEQESQISDFEDVIPVSSVEDLSKQLADAEKKAQELWDNLLRQRAESENLRKRVERDLDNARKYALEKFAKELLAVKDSMELGLEAVSKPETEMQAVHDGMALTLKMLTDTLEKFEIVVIDPLNEKFDPQWHEAMAIQPVPEVEDGTVILVHQKGYQLFDRLLRPARVIVAKTIETSTTEEKPLEN
jgi:molecular chaperone GrpE